MLYRRNSIFPEGASLSWRDWAPRYRRRNCHLDLVQLWNAIGWGFGTLRESHGGGRASSELPIATIETGIASCSRPRSQIDSEVGAWAGRSRLEFQGNNHFILDAITRNKATIAQPG